MIGNAEFVTFYSKQSSEYLVANPDTEKKYQIPESLHDHLVAAHDHAESDETLYHIREALQISESESESADGVSETVAE
jgi:hypothetical protein